MASPRTVDTGGDIAVTTLRAAVLASLRDWRTTAAEDTVRLLFVAPPAEIRAAFDLPDLGIAADELFLRDLMATVVEIGTPGVVVAVARPSGRPLRRDRRLRAVLAARFATSPVALVDVMLVGRDDHWPPAARCPGARAGAGVLRRPRQSGGAVG